MVRTTSSPDRRTARRALDRFATLRPFVAEATAPRGGWTWAIREAPGMSMADLAHRVGVRVSSVASLERGEREGRVQLATLKRAAAALGCDLVYAVIPRTSLVDVVQERALTKAIATVGPVVHSMLLEDQAVAPEAARALLDDLTVRALHRDMFGRVWSWAGRNRQRETSIGGRPETGCYVGPGPPGRRTRVGRRGLTDGDR